MQKRSGLCDKALALLRIWNIESQPLHKLFRILCPTSLLRGSTVSGLPTAHFTAPSGFRERFIISF